MPFLRTIIFLQVLAGILVASQSTDVVCMPGWSWASNSHGQNPCLVGAYILGVCEGPYQIQALPGSHYSYTGPQKYQDNYCQCSTVTFSLVSACGLCQNATTITWSTWSINCTVEYLQQYIGVIPSGTSVPAWAYLDVKSTDRFNPYIAQQAAGFPESSATLVKPTGTWLPTTRTSEKKSNIGAIAGGVLGGLVGLTFIVAFVATMICYIRRLRRRAHTAPSTHATRYLNPRQTAPELQYDLNRISHVPSMTSQKLYDPSDPSTYPTTPLTSTSVYTTKPPVPTPGYLVHSAPAPIL